MMKNVMSFFILLLSIEDSIAKVAGRATHYPSSWSGLWHSSKTNLEVSISPDIFGDQLETIEELSLTEENLSVNGTEIKIITFLESENCRRCRLVDVHHENVIAFKVSQCLPTRNQQKLCDKARLGLKEYLYRLDTVPQEPCPSGVLSTSWNSYFEVRYDEYLPDESSTYVKNCGSPRSELTSCYRRGPEDPQFNLNLGPCETSSLVHRRSLTQNLQCVGSWKDQWGTEFVVTRGFEYDYWSDGHYNSNNVFRCFAISGNPQSDVIRMSQGFGSDCQGLGSGLTTENGHRRLTLTRTKLDLQECEFPHWVTANRVWSVIPRAGLRLESSQTTSSSRKVFFPDKLTFTLASKEETGGQRFRCAKILHQLPNEVILETFTQSQCYREFHCFHAKLNPEAGLVDLHVGSPTPNSEHACVKPNFDEEVPFLLATLMPFTKSLNVQNFEEQNSLPKLHLQSSDQVDVDNSPPLTSQEENLVKIKNHALALLRSYERDHLKKVEELINDMTRQIRLLYES